MFGALFGLQDSSGLVPLQLDLGEAFLDLGLLWVQVETPPEDGLGLV